MFEQFIELGPRMVNTFQWVQDALGLSSVMPKNIERTESWDKEHNGTITSLDRSVATLQCGGMSVLIIPLKQLGKISKSGSDSPDTAPSAYSRFSSENRAIRRQVHVSGREDRGKSSISANMRAISDDGSQVSFEKLHLLHAHAQMANDRRKAYEQRKEELDRRRAFDSRSKTSVTDRQYRYEKLSQPQQLRWAAADM